PAVGVERRPQPGLGLGVLLEVRNRRVVRRIEHHEHLARQGHRLEDAVEAGDDGVALVVCGDDDRDARLHSRTPSPSRPQMSTTGLSVGSDAYALCGAPTMSRSARAITSSSGSRSGSTLTNGSVVSTAAALNRRMRLSL